MTTQALSRLSTRRHHERLSRFYDAFAALAERPLRRAALRLLNAARGERILEIGCGAGDALQEIAESVDGDGRAFGIDHSPGMVAVAGHRLRQHGLFDRAELTVGDAALLPYASGSLDAVFTAFTLEHITPRSLPAVLAECQRVLRPGGRLVVLALSSAGHAPLIAGLLGWLHRRAPSLLDGAPIRAAAAMSAAGFRIVTARRRFFWVPVEQVVALKA